MSLTPNTEPVLLANLLPGLLSAVVFVLTAFDVWDPTEDQIAAVSGLLAVLLTVATAFARGKAWSPASVDKVTGALDTALAKVETAQAEQVRVLTERSFAPFSPPVGLIEPIAEPPPPPPPSGSWAERPDDLDDDTAFRMRSSALLNRPTQPRGA